MQTESQKFTASIDRSQSDKFKEAARQIEADEDEANWEARLKAIARQKPKDTQEKPE